MKLLLAKSLTGLVPTDEESEEALRKIARGEIVSCEIKRPRNLRLHRLWWKLMSTVAENTTGYKAEHISDDVLIGIGHCHTIKRPDGTIILTPRSISFSSMDNDEFSGLFDKATRYICEIWLPGLDSDVLRQEVYDLLDDGKRAAYNARKGSNANSH